MVLISRLLDSLTLNSLLATFAFGLASRMGVRPQAETLKWCITMEDFM